ncbi:MAG: hypothetical protein QMC93_03650 [Patescibacteria group bacterium]|nr:hypothetical protein [Patescibacteria group bacterium]
MGNRIFSGGNNFIDNEFYLSSLKTRKREEVIKMEKLWFSDDCVKECQKLVKRARKRTREFLKVNKWAYFRPEELIAMHILLRNNKRRW